MFVLDTNAGPADQSHRPTARRAGDRHPAAAGEFLRTQDYVNGKVGIYGYSYGGITSIAAIARVPGVDAAVPMAGIYAVSNTLPASARVSAETSHPVMEADNWNLLSSVGRPIDGQSPLHETGVGLGRGSG